MEIMTNSTSSVCYSFFVGTLLNICFTVSSLYFQGKPTGFIVKKKQTLCPPGYY